MMKINVRLIIPVLAAVLLAGGCASQSTGGAEARQAEVAAEFQAIIETLAAPEMEGRDAGTEGLAMARDYLVDRFEAIGLEPGFRLKSGSGANSPRVTSYLQPFTVTTGTTGSGEDVKTIEATVSNVAGILPGQGDLKEQVIVVGGHYDHVGYGHFGSRSRSAGEIHPGADDNASGTAGVILLAERMAEYARANPDKPRRTIFFTGFAAEERGLLGARYMTSNPAQWPFAVDDLAGMINMDMIGRLEDEDLYIFADQTGDQWRPWLKQANRGIGLDLQFDVRPPGGSDHSLFIGIGCPAIFFNTWLHADYHTPTDTPDKINAKGGARVIALVGKLLEQVATSEERLAFIEPTPPAPRPILGVRLVRQPSNDTQGALIEEVLEGGAAAEAKLQAGDLVTAFDGKPIKSPTDLRQVLNSKKPGDVVPITVFRDGQTLEASIKLGRR